MNADVNRLAIEVHRESGPGLLRSAYQRALAHELRLRHVRLRTGSCARFVEFSLHHSPAWPEASCSVTSVLTSVSSVSPNQFSPTYEAVIGLEVQVQIKTRSKVFTRVTGTHQRVLSL